MRYIGKGCMVLLILSVTYSNSIFAKPMEKEKKCLTIEQPTEQEIKKLGCSFWPTFSSPVKTWPETHYTSAEICYFIQGELKVVTESGDEYLINEGDLVTFHKGCVCTWIVTKPLKKNYKYEH